jgi:hypothetical protein
MTSRCWAKELSAGDGVKVSFVMRPSFYEAETLDYTEIFLYNLPDNRTTKLNLISPPVFLSGNVSASSPKSGSYTSSL